MFRSKYTWLVMGILLGWLLVPMVLALFFKAPAPPPGDLNTPE